ncbi:MAG TPA: hypothetical protein VEX42_02295 [Microbacterium sp.]|nr:hypothetical protein [Microbacterium sp.]
MSKNARSKESHLLFARDRPSTLGRLDRDSRLHRIRAGVYIERAAWDGLAPWDRYRMRVRAVAATWTAPVFCLEAAATVHNLPIFGEPRWIHLLGPGGLSWREGDVVVHGTRDERDVSERDGMLVTPLADTTLDLCRVLPPAFALGVADRAFRWGGRGRPLGERGREQANRRGVRQLDWIDENADPLAESAGESVSRAVTGWLGYERPRAQVTFRYEGVEDRVDFLFPSTQAIAESDGYGKYDADDPEAMKLHFVAEKRREDRLRRNGHPFARWDWADTMAARPLDRALRAAGLSPGRSPDRRGLATLATNPRSF